MEIRLDQTDIHSFSMTQAITNCHFNESIFAIYRKNGKNTLIKK